MQIDLEKIKKLPADVRKDFYKMYVKYGEKKKQGKIVKSFFLQEFRRGIYMLISNCLQMMVR